MPDPHALAIIETNLPDFPCEADEQEDEEGKRCYGVVLAHFSAVGSLPGV